MKRWVPGLVVLLVVIAASGMTWRHQRIEQGRCDLVHRLDAQQHVAERATGTVVVGDSYSQGYGLDDAATAWPFDLGRPVSVQASSGAGWTREGLCGGLTLAELTSEQRDAETLIVQGGLNDTDDPGDVRMAMSTALRGVTAAHVVVVGPPLAPAREAAKVRAVDDAMRAAASERGARYVSLLQVDLPYQSDRLHLTEAGHQRLGEIVRDAL